MTRVDRIEAAARALLADIDPPLGSRLCSCSASGCHALAMVTDGFVALCDAHTANARCSLSERSYAPAVRALRAALAEVP